jgi:hypothetical protein
METPAVDTRASGNVLLRWLNGFLVLLLVLQALLFVLHAVQVIRFPHDVDNGEGFLLAQSLDYNQGRWPYKPLDEPPHLVANYPPLYPLLCSVGTAFLGPVLGVGRSITFAATLGVTFLLGWMLYRQTGRKLYSAVAALFFIGTYHVYNWGIFHRVDMTGLFFCTLALALCVVRAHWLAIAFACFLGLMTRQTLLAAPLAIGCYWICQQRVRYALRFWIVLGVLIGGATLLLDRLTQGEYFRHTVTYNNNAFIAWTIFYYARHLWQFYGILCAFGLFYLLRGAILRRFDLTFWFIVFACCSALLCGKIGSAPNYLLELVLALCWALGALCSEVRILEGSARSWAELFLPSLLIFQVLGPFHLTHFPPLITTQRFDFGWTPSAEDWKREEVVSYLIRRTPGTVLVEDPGIALRAGKEPIYHPFICPQLENQGLWDQTPIIRRIDAKEFPLIVLRVNMDEATVESDRFNDRIIQAIKANYQVKEVVTGYRTFYLHRPRLEEPAH